jgi:outer membrane protein assembly factor BamA
MFRKKATVVSTKKAKKKGITPLQKSFDKYSCRIIRKINIETLDPFGFSAEDEKAAPRNRIERIGNFMHIKSKNWTIRNLLLFKKYDELDSMIVKESERLIRSQRYVRSVIIRPIPIENCKDSVDIYIRVLDTWSSIPTGAFSSSKANLDVTERNIFGLGHEFDFNYLKSFTDNTYNSYGYDTKYTIPNYKNTFIKTSTSFKNDLNNNTYKTARIDRPFYSTLTHWAGGMYYNYESFSQILTDANAISAKQDFKIKSYDFGVLTRLLFSETIPNLLEERI